MNLATLTAHHAAVVEARKFKGDRSTNGYSYETEQRLIEERRAQLVAQALTTYSSTLPAATDAAFSDAEQRRSATDAAWRNPSDDDAAGAILNRKHRWERIEARLNNGDSLGIIIDDADPADLAAIGEWGTHRAIIEQMQQSGGLTGMLTGQDPARAVYDRLTARMAELEPSSDHAAAIAAAREALIVSTYQDDPEALNSLYVELHRTAITDASPFQVLAEFHRAHEMHRETHGARAASNAGGDQS